MKFNQSFYKPRFIQVESIPNYFGFWKISGPGFIWASMALGSGELIWWPYLIAKYGATFLSLLLPACLAQYFVNLEINRYTTITGEGVFQGFVRLNYIFGIFLWLMMVISFAWFGSYVTSGATAIAEIVPIPGFSKAATSMSYSYIMITGFAAILLFYKKAFKFIEIFMKVMVTICLICIITAMFNVEIINAVDDFFYHYFDYSLLFRAGFPENWQKNDSSVLLTAICFSGMGGFLNIMYSYWIKEKGISVSSYSINSSEDSGYIYSDTMENKSRYYQWLNHVKIENFLAIFLNILMVTCMCLFAWALLAPDKIYPEGWDIAVVQARLFQSSMGNIGKYLFLIIAASFLCDTWIGIADACAKIHVDFFRSTFSFARRYKHEYMYKFFIICLLVISFVTIPIASPGPLLLLGGVFNFLAMPIYCLALLRINYFILPKIYPNWVKPNKFESIMFVTVIALYLLLTFLYIKSSFTNI